MWDFLFKICLCFPQVYNLGTGKGYSVLDMVKATEKASGKNVSRPSISSYPYRQPVFIVHAA